MQTIGRRWTAHRASYSCRPCTQCPPLLRPHAMARLLARIVGVGVETADMLAHEVLSRPMRERRAVARYAGLTGAPDESGAQRRKQGLARAGNARVCRGMSNSPGAF